MARVDVDNREYKKPKSSISMAGRPIKGVSSGKWLFTILCFPVESQNWTAPITIRSGGLGVAVQPPGGNTGRQKARDLYWKQKWEKRGISGYFLNCSELGLECRAGPDRRDDGRAWWGSQFGGRGTILLFCPSCLPHRDGKGVLGKIEVNWVFEFKLSALEWEAF